MTPATTLLKATKKIKYLFMIAVANILWHVLLLLTSLFPQVSPDAWKESWSHMHILKDKRYMWICLTSSLNQKLIFNEAEASDSYQIYHFREDIHFASETHQQLCHVHAFFDESLPDPPNVRWDQTNMTLLFLSTRPSPEQILGKLRAVIQWPAADNLWSL